MSEKNITAEFIEEAAALIRGGEEYSELDLYLLFNKYGYTGDPSHVMDAVMALE